VYSSARLIFETWFNPFRGEKAVVLVRLEVNRPMIFLVVAHVPKMGHFFCPLTACVNLNFKMFLAI
jgi:hypothetical protein